MFVRCESTCPTLLLITCKNLMAWSPHAKHGCPEVHPVRVPEVWLARRLTRWAGEHAAAPSFIPARRAPVGDSGAAGQRDSGAELWARPRAPPAKSESASQKARRRASAISQAPRHGAPGTAPGAARGTACGTAPGVAPRPAVRARSRAGAGARDVLQLRCGPVLRVWNCVSSVPRRQVPRWLFDSFRAEGFNHHRRCNTAKMDCERRQSVENGHPSDPGAQQSVVWTELQQRVRRPRVAV